jgi:hypothetical protein
VVLQPTGPLPVRVHRGQFPWHGPIELGEKVEVTLRSVVVEETRLFVEGYAAKKKPPTRSGCELVAAAEATTADNPACHPAVAGPE